MVSGLLWYIRSEIDMVHEVVVLTAAPVQTFRTIRRF